MATRRRRLEKSLHRKIEYDDELPPYAPRDPGYRINPAWDVPELVPDEDPPCTHWAESECRLTLRPRQCCSCIDKRPETESGLYPMYVDGEGWVERAARWKYYCSGCHDYFQAAGAPNALPDRRAEQQKPGKAVESGDEETDWNGCGLGRWILKYLRGCKGTDGRH
ncbi:hypothetical protein GGS23DRAFT_595522 [Durotheca rogersii]|uniref:uncharacterized protein n=1 Tax=Durotheca rogersii TaxID=419775 RepID=UPI0022202D2F|nr:uncharacterized protein GGS23DRAFT_595522 [Durotheca rogersii]KAI5864829.1 hypothetical protein GGS23DRAFT_595522 [Durotheca rogersii]